MSQHYNEFEKSKLGSSLGLVAIGLGSGLGLVAIGLGSMKFGSGQTCVKFFSHFSVNVD